MLRWLESVAQDLQHAIRNLRRSPALVVVSLLSLGLGIGLNLTLYSGVMTIFRHQPTMERAQEVVGVEPGNGRQFSFENYRDLRASRAFADVVGFRVAAMNRRTGDDLQRVGVLVVTDNFFEALGIRPRLGRTFAAAEAAAERSPRVVVVDHAYWQAQLNANPNVVGETLVLDGEAFTVSGVLPADYRSVTGFMSPSLYVPASTLTLPTLNDRGSPTLSVLARLAPGDARERARDKVTAVAAELERRFPEINEGMSRPAQVFSADAMQFRGTPAGFQLLPVVLLVLFGLVLLIGSVNVAGLLLARAVSRRHELTVRSALGASRARVVQALLSESFILALLGTGAGLALMLVLSRVDWLRMGPLSRVFAPDRQLLLPAVFMVALTTLLCGMAPALKSTRVDLLAGLRKGATDAADRLRLRNLYVAGQVALSLVLLTVASLCWRSQARIAEIDLGFDIDHGVVTRFTTEPTRESAEAREAFADQVVERIASIPGVQAAAVTGLVPLGGDALVASFHPAGRTDIPGTRPSTLSVGPGYFKTLSIPVREGREFDASHRQGTPAVAIVNQTFANTYFPGRSALGEQVDIGGEAYAEIIGVVRDSKIDTLGEAPKSVVYYPFAQRPRRLTVIARTSGDPALIAPTVRAAVNAIDVRAKIDVSTLRDAASTELNMRRVGTQMTGAIGLVGVLLTTIGLYGIVTYLVMSRTAELAIRMALGATSRQLFREVLRHAVRLVGAGLVVGAALSLLITPTLTVFLAGLSPADPTAFLLAAAALVLVTLAASYLPARRVTQVDPAIALRE
jgi:putative ABC transport system permease protein